MENKDIVIIGAGLTGLTTAYYIQKSNSNYVVLEKNETIGGVIKTKTENGFTYELGPNTGVINNTTVVELFDEIQNTCNLTLANNLVKKRFILKNGKLEALPLGILAGMRTPLFTTADKFRLLLEPWKPKGTNPNENLSSFVRRRLGNSFLDYAIEPFILGVYAGNPDYLIPKYALPKLYNIEQSYGSLIGGSIRKMFSKKTPLEKRVNKKVYSFTKGLSELTQALENHLTQNSIICSVQNIQVIKSENGYKVEYKKNNKTIRIQSKVVISTVTATEIPNIFPFLDAKKLEKITCLQYAKIVVATVGFKKWNGRELDGFGCLIPSKEKRSILGILFMSSLFVNRAPEGGALLTVFLGGFNNPHVYDKSETEIKEIVAQECSSILEIAEFTPDFFHINKHATAIPQYGLDSKERIEAIHDIVYEHVGIILGGNIIDGIGMGDRIAQGKELSKCFI